MASFATCTVHGENVFLDEEFKEGMIATRCTECSVVVEIRNVPETPQEVRRHITGAGRILGIRSKMLYSQN